MKELSVSSDFHFTISTAESRKATKWKNEKMSWLKLLQRISSTTRTKEMFAEYMNMSTDEQASIKDVGGYLIGELKDGIRQNDNVLNRRIVTLDADFIGEHDFWEGLQLIQDYACAVYSTHKHTSEAKRLRLLIPLDREVSADEYEPIARALASDLGIDYFDDTSYQKARLMFWPSTSSDGEFVFDYQDGELVSADELLSRYKDYKNPNEWTYSSRVKERKRIERDIKKAGNPLEKPNAIGLFCRTYSIHEAIETFLSEIYEPTKEEGRYTYINGSTWGGVRTYEDLFSYSHHGTDPVSSQLVNAFDLVRIHLFGDIDDDDDMEKDVVKRPSYARMVELVQKDNKAQQQLIEDTRQSAINDFGDLVDDEEEQTNNNIDIADHFFSKHGFNPTKLADCLVQANPIITVDGIVYVYENGVYVADNERKVRRMTARVLGDRYRSTHGNEVVEIIKDLHTVKSIHLEKPSTKIVNLKNGLLDWRTGELMPHRSDFISFSQIPVRYDETAKCPNIEKFISEVVPADSINMVYELFGLCLIPKNVGVAFFLLGSGSNGKSVFIDLLNAFIGEENISNVSLQDLSSNRFKLAQLQNKLLNTQADLPGSALSDTDIFKAVVTSDKLNAERKNVDAFNFRPYARLVYGMNRVPTARDFSKGFIRRLKIITFPNSFGGNGAKGKKADVNLLEKLTTEQELSGLLNKAIAGLRTLMERGRFEDTASSREALKDYIAFSDPLQTFIDEMCVLGEENKIVAEELHNAYIEYLRESNVYSTPTRSQFVGDMQSKGFEYKRTFGSTKMQLLGIALLSRNNSVEGDFKEKDDLLA